VFHLLGIRSIPNFAVLASSNHPAGEKRPLVVSSGSSWLRRLL